MFDFFILGIYLKEIFNDLFISVDHCRMTYILCTRVDKSYSLSLFMKNCFTEAKYQLNDLRLVHFY